MALPTKARARAGAGARAAAGAGAVTLLLGNLFLQHLLLLHLHVAGTEATRAGYRLPQTMGRSAGQSDAKADNGSGRDLFKKFMLWRGLFPQEPPRDNIIVVPQPSPTFTTTTTPTTTTTTTTTTNNNGTSTRRWRNLENTEDLPAPTLPTSQMLDNGGAQKRVTKRHRNASKSRTRSNGKLRRQRRRRRDTVTFTSVSVSASGSVGSVSCAEQNPSEIWHNAIDTGLEQSPSVPLLPNSKS